MSQPCNSRRAARCLPPAPHVTRRSLLQAFPVLRGVPRAPPPYPHWAKPPTPPLFLTPRQALLDLKLEKPKKLRQESSRYWSEIPHETLDFDRDQNDAKARAARRACVPPPAWGPLATQPATRLLATHPCPHTPAHTRTTTQRDVTPRDVSPREDVTPET